MNACSSLRRVVAVATLASFGVLTACGSSATEENKPVDSSTAMTPADDLGAEEWMLRFNLAGGADGAETTALYVRFTPKTGAAETLEMPAVLAAEATGDGVALLVNADHTWAIPDAKINPKEAASGQLNIYPVAGGAPTSLDFGAATGDAKALPVGWAFDPGDANVLRVVDAANVVWKVDFAARKATKEAALEKTDMQFFANGFDKNTGEPYLVRVDSNDTVPPGNGDLDKIAPLTRDGGSLLVPSGGKYAGLPDPGCDYSTGFLDAQKTAWVFCTEDGVVTTVRHRKDDATFEPYGKPSGDVVPPSAGEFPVVLPPT